MKKPVYPTRPEMTLVVNPQGSALRTLHALGGSSEPAPRGKREYRRITFPAGTTFADAPYRLRAGDSLAHYGVHLAGAGTFLELLHQDAPLFADSTPWLLMQYRYDLRRAEELAVRWAVHEARARERGTYLCQLGFCLQELALFCDMCNRPACREHLRSNLCEDCYDEWLDRQEARALRYNGPRERRAQ